LRLAVPGLLCLPGQTSGLGVVHVNDWAFGLTGPGPASEAQRLQLSARPSLSTVPPRLALRPYLGGRLHVQPAAAPFGLLRSLLQLEYPNFEVIVVTMGQPMKQRTLWSSMAFA